MSIVKQFLQLQIKIPKVNKQNKPIQNKPIQSKTIQSKTINNRLCLQSEYCNMVNNTYFASLPIEILEIIFNFIDYHDHYTKICFALLIPSLCSIYKKREYTNRIPDYVKRLTEEPLCILLKLINIYGLYNVINFCTVNISPFLKTQNGIKFVNYIIHNSKSLEINSHRQINDIPHNKFHIKVLSNERIANIADYINNKDVDYIVINRLLAFFDNTINFNNIRQNLISLSLKERSLILRYAPRDFNIKDIIIYDMWWSNVIIEAIKMNYVNTIDVILDNLKFDNKMLPILKVSLFIICQYEVLDSRKIITYYLEKLISKIGYVNAIWNIIIGKAFDNTNYEYEHNEHNEYNVYISQMTLSKQTEIIEYLLGLPEAINGISSIIIKYYHNISSNLINIIKNYYKKNNIYYNLNIIHKNLVYQIEPFSVETPDPNNTMFKDQYNKYVSIIDSSLINDKELLKEVYKNLLTETRCCETCFIKEIYKYKIEKKISESIPMLRLSIDKLQSALIIHNTYIDCLKEKIVKFNTLNINVSKDEKILELLNIYNYIVTCLQFIKTHNIGKLSNAIIKSIIKNEGDLIDDNSNNAIKLKKIFENIKTCLQ